MENIFEGAKFGDVFYLKDGRPASFITFYLAADPNGEIHEDNNEWRKLAQCYVAEEGEQPYLLDGKHYDPLEYGPSEDQEFELVSRQNEPISDEQLRELALEHIREGYLPDYDEDYEQYSFKEFCEHNYECEIDSFETGYRLAENKK